MRTKFFAIVAVILAVAFMILVLASWLLSAMMTEGVRSLLSSEGVRWFFRHFVDLLQKPLLIWMLLGGMAWGALHASGMLHPAHNFRSRMALRMVALLFIIMIAVVAMLTMTSHAVLLSASGRLWPSPFSNSIVPIIAFGMVILSMAYGFVSGSMRSLNDAFSSLSQGVAALSPLLVLYILAMQLYESILFVFCSTT